jgi:hypothetical protein
MKSLIETKIEQIDAAAMPLGRLILETVSFWY